MRFEWDADKDRSNLLKHGIDFEEAKNLWLDENRIQIRAPYPVEDRGILISKYKGKLSLTLQKPPNQTRRGHWKSLVAGTF